MPAALPRARNADDEPSHPRAAARARLVRRRHERANLHGHAYAGRRDRRHVPWHCVRHPVAAIWRAHRRRDDAERACHRSVRRRRRPGRGVLSAPALLQPGPHRGGHGAGLLHRLARRRAGPPAALRLRGRASLEFAPGFGALGLDAALRRRAHPARAGARERRTRARPRRARQAAQVLRAAHRRQCGGHTPALARTPPARRPLRRLPAGERPGERGAQR
mmetsp:Transcript_27836/g.88440  ORF Transcript_27836/g.88440 Transcript_27836/m.88440 type:complete len:220 (-) Transcript_27836:3790-4449(-)